MPTKLMQRNEAHPLIIQSSEIKTPSTDWTPVDQKSSPTHPRMGIPYHRS